ncbi:MAG: ABC transporter permease [Anaerolineae bacterium]|jgi:spermidine/putrescine transport system permease protein
MTDATTIQGGNRILAAIRRRPGLGILALIFPSLFWLIVFFLIPLIIVFVYSFLKRGPYGQIEWEFNLQNYARFFDPLYLRVFARSFKIAGITTIVCFLLGYPMAYWMATRPARWRNTLLLLLMIPFWTNFLVRTYAWILILRDSGLVNNALMSLGLISQPLPLFGNDLAIVIGLVYGWFPDMVLPCYAAIERLDFSLVEAAQDLYANELRAFARIIFPLTLPGVVAGSILVFIPSLGAYVTPDLLGGAKSVMIGNVIQSQFLSVRDYPFGSAFSFVLMAMMLIATLLYFRVGGRTM